MSDLEISGSGVVLMKNEPESQVMAKCFGWTVVLLIFAIFIIVYLYSSEQEFDMDNPSYRCENILNLF